MISISKFSPNFFHTLCVTTTTVSVSDEDSLSTAFPLSSHDGVHKIKFATTQPTRPNRTEAKKFAMLKFVACNFALVHVSVRWIDRKSHISFKEFSEILEVWKYFGLHHVPSVAFLKQYFTLLNLAFYYEFIQRIIVTWYCASSFRFLSDRCIVYRSELFLTAAIYKVLVKTRTLLTGLPSVAHEIISRQKRIRQMPYDGSSPRSGTPSQHFWSHFSQLLPNRSRKNPNPWNVAGDDDDDNNIKNNNNNGDNITTTTTTTTTHVRLFLCLRSSSWQCVVGVEVRLRKHSTSCVINVLEHSD